VIDVLSLGAAIAARVSTQHAYVIGRRCIGACAPEALLKRVVCPVCVCGSVPLLTTASLFLCPIGIPFAEPLIRALRDIQVSLVRRLGLADSRQIRITVGPPIGHQTLAITLVVGATRLSLARALFLDARSPPWFQSIRADP
jgi:hypothetical protein